jgi:hypothetical protein
VGPGASGQLRQIGTRRETAIRHPANGARHPGARPPLDIQKGPQIARTRAPETLQFASCTTASKPTRVAPPTWWPWRSTSAKRAERSLGARCPGERTRCPSASAAGVARSCGYGTGRGTEAGGATSATGALESDLVRLVPRRCLVAADQPQRRPILFRLQDRRLPLLRQILEAASLE